MKVSIDSSKYTWYRDTGGRKTFHANKGVVTSRLSISLVREGKKWMEEGRGKERMKKEPTEGRV